VIEAATAVGTASDGDDADRPLPAGIGAVMTPKMARGDHREPQ
jgi:hypothetical protein